MKIDLDTPLTAMAALNLSTKESYDYVLSKTSYNGKDLVWNIKDRYVYPGMLCGREDRHGYRRIHIRRYGMLGAHRIIFYKFHGWIPQCIDHINGDPRDNRIENLRAATLCQNSQSAKTPVTNTSGRKGVYKHRDGKWQASIRVNDKLKHLGLFARFEDAVAARVRAESELHGDFARH